MYMAAHTGRILKVEGSLNAMDIKGVFKILVVFKRCVFVDTYLRQLEDRYIT